MSSNPFDSLISPYNQLIIPNPNIKPSVKYWVCDTEMAVGDTQDNVFLHDYGFNGEVVKQTDFIAFKSKSGAVGFSKDLYILECGMYS